ncbi:MAG: outer membrane lipoprotein-sorting protein [Deltaproteobacteria bacterium]|nr:outer membrane lipoprotein-sorting protein [Deltaproteobacteria bacterium]
MMRRVILAVILAAVLALPASAEELTGEQIVDKMAAGLDQTNMMAELKMVLVSSSGQKRERTLRSRAKESGDLSKTVITFEEPADVRGTKFLVIENEGRDDDQMLYLPALKKTRRIASSQRSGSFMGSDFSYADLSTRDSDEGKHTRLADEAIDGVEFYVVETVPTDADSEYSRVKYWVRKDNFVVTKGEFYEKGASDKLLKIMTGDKFEEYKPGKWMAREITMKNVQKGTATEVQVVKYKVDAAVDDDYFTERFLKDESQL